MFARKEARISGYGNSVIFRTYRDHAHPLCALFGGGGGVFFVEQSQAQDRRAGRRQKGGAGACSVRKAGQAFDLASHLRQHRQRRRDGAGGAAVHGDDRGQHRARDGRRGARGGRAGAHFRRDDAADPGGARPRKDGEVVRGVCQGGLRGLFPVDLAVRALAQAARQGAQTQKGRVDHRRRADHLCRRGTDGGRHRRVRGRAHPFGDRV